MEAFDRKAIAELTAPCQGHCVTIAMSRGHSWSDSAQDRVCLKTLLHGAEKLLGERGLSADAARQMLADGWRLEADDADWGAPGAGLAFFAGERLSRIFATPIPLQETVAVDRRFWLTPLATLCQPDAAWRLLAVSQHSVSMFRADRYHIHEVEVPGMPTNLEETLNLDVRDRVTQYHGAVSMGRQGRSAVVHGQGGKPDEHKDDLLTYCRAIDRAVRGVLQSRHEPLVFVGVDYLFPIFREANTYPHLSEAHVAGSPDDWSAAELHARAWPLIAPHFDARRNEGLARLDDPIGVHTATSFDAVLAAAERGQVDTLFANVDARRWGSWNAAESRSATRATPRPGDEELVNRAIVDVLRQGGRIWPVEANRLPPGEPLGAVLRYAIS